MLSDFPFVKRKLDKVINKHLRNTVDKNAPLLSMMSRRNLYEGDKVGVIYSDGKHIVNELKTAHSEFSINHDDIPSLKADQFISKVSNAAEDIAGQIERGMIQTIDDVVSKTGNIISGGVVGPDLILEMLDKIRITFEEDDRQKPNMPSIISGEQVFNKFLEFEKNGTQTEKDEFHRKEKEILDRKYIEYIKDLKSRQLID